MANVKSKKFVDKLEDLAWTYINDCISHKKEQLTSKGERVNVKDRHIPTVDYFLNIWIPLNYSKKDTIKRSTYYRWLNWDNTYKQNIIKNIDNWFKSLAGDIVANEGKGIFYAKNKLGWTDKQENTIQGGEKPIQTIDYSKVSTEALKEIAEASAEDDNKPEN